MGALTIILAIATYGSDKPLGDVASWITQSMGSSFLGLLLTLSGLALYSWLTLHQGKPDRTLYVMGIHAANGIATIALTFTLFGISKGIGGLAQSSLSPETVAGIISELTRGFQQAFITTVVGLPISAILRAMLHVAGSRVFVEDE